MKEIMIIIVQYGAGMAKILSPWRFCQNKNGGGGIIAA